MNTIKEEFKLNEKEYKKHNTFRKFCINNYLTLNEHGVYCNCVSVSIDNLSIGYNGLILVGNNVFKLELLLNRIKSEFHNARTLYYEGINNTKLNSEVLYFDLQEGENISESTENIRISFRLCFGILDKIALGICYLFNLKTKVKENIYFESFWNNPSNPKKWDKLKVMKNPHLLSLYSIANDLNLSNGEFNHYKIWRNMLEHNILILKNDEHNQDPLKVLDDSSYVTTVSYTYFIEQALQLLQLTRTAIFSFTYLVRTESLSDDKDDSLNFQFIKPKL